MDLFTLAAPFFDLAMKISGHNKVLVELGERIKKEELKSNFKKKNKSLLDLGGGTGELVNHLPQNLEITIVDPSKAMLKKGQKKNFSQPVNHILADAADLPFDDDLFDYLIISDALHHFRQVDSALKEAARVLKPGAKIYILEFDPSSFFTRLIVFFEKLAGEPVNFYQPQKLVSMLDKNELKTEHEYLNKSLYIIQGEKSFE
jgi:demethylmenaquinone methyltransferase/2-methoxy-6-polyprenyl-1,4-benzoquinol methylase